MVSFVQAGLRLGAIVAASTFAIGALAQSPPAAGSTPADDAHAKAVLTQSCTGCHELSMLTAKPHAPGEWTDIIQQMIGMGASVPAADVQPLARYLAKTYSPPAK